MKTVIPVSFYSFFLVCLNNGPIVKPMMPPTPKDNSMAQFPFQSNENKHTGKMMQEDHAFEAILGYRAY